MKLEIRKSKSGPNRWWIWLLKDDYPKESTVRGFKTKTLATLFVNALHGDTVSAQSWYRKSIERKLKDPYTYPTPEDAWEETAFTAKQYGFSPDFVNADPDTFEPK